MKSLACACLTSALLACGGTPARPNGLPAPVYEEPRVEPWPTASSLAALPSVAFRQPSGGSDATPAGPAPTQGGSSATLPEGPP